jgi:uncharacterized membrane protein
MFPDMLTAVTFYDVVLFVHVFAVIVAFGPTFAYPVFLAVAERTDPRALPAVGRGIAAWDRIAMILLAVILLAGLYLVADGPWSFGDFYVSWGFLAVIVIGGLSGMYFTPKTRELIELAERDVGGPAGGELSAEFHELNRKVGQVGMFAGLLVLLTVYVMVAKPFL